MACLNSLIHLNILIKTGKLQCCKEFRLSWNQENIIKAGNPMASPVGIYKKASFHADNCIVYHNEKTGYYLYTLGDEWVVRNNSYVINLMTGS